jgi:hypothetical protein
VGGWTFVEIFLYRTTGIFNAIGCRVKGIVSIS